MVAEGAILFVDNSVELDVVADLDDIDLEKLNDNFGRPEFIVCDNGTEFTSLVMARRK